MLTIVHTTESRASSRREASGGRIPRSPGWRGIASRSRGIASRSRGVATGSRGIATRSSCWRVALRIQRRKKISCVRQMEFIFVLAESDGHNMSI